MTEEKHGKFAIKQWGPESPERWAVISAAPTIYAHPVQFSGSYAECMAYVAAPLEARQLLAAACPVTGWNCGAFKGVI